MIPVKQTILHDPEHGRYGNCFQVCIASLMELPIEAVPHFCDGPESDNWLEHTNKWFSDFYGLIYIEFQITGDGKLKRNLNAWRNGHDIYHTLKGYSSRDTSIIHTVIGKNGIPFFDPHPDNKMLHGTPFLIGFILKSCT